ncbi:MAG: TIGR03435 family protein [Bryobacteraceae bacterium]
MRFWAPLLLCLPLSAQTPTFEVASIRLANRTLTGLHLCGRVDVSSDTILSSESLLTSGIHRLDGLIDDAYRDEVDDFDLPQWVRNNGSFAVSVKIPPNTTARACRKMLQSLLAERFHLVVEIETRDVPRYYLKVAKSGMKLKSAGPAADPDGGYVSSVKDGISRYVFNGAPASRVFRVIEMFAALDGRARRIGGKASLTITETSTHGVIDEAGLTGYYDGDFQFAMLGILHDEFAESLDDALKRQLGLTLELRKAPGKVLVIRSSDRTPTEN